jgi:phospholipid/cholesterol/gamma-HCH transport system substrate-binding protein
MNVRCPNGRRYTQADLANPGNKTWQSMLVPPGR